MIKTAITEMFGIKYPIMCGAMMWLSKPGLCAAISNAGGMGNITAGNYESEEDFRNAIRQTKELTDKPFVIGLTMLPSIRITGEHHKMYVKVCAEEKVAAIEVSGSPLDKVVGREGMDMLKNAGVKLFHKVGSVRHALHAQKAGYDGVYAAGFEEGGHPLDDDVTTMVLTPRIADSVDIPVVTVGGISDGRSMAAALTLGAQGVMMASRFIATKECEVHPNIKQELINRQENETTLICKSIGLQGRALKNKVVADVLAVEKRGGGLEELIPLISGERIKNAWNEGLSDEAPLMVGQSIGHIREVISCEDLMKNMIDDAISHLNKVTGMIN